MNKLIVPMIMLLAIYALLDCSPRVSPVSEYAKRSFDPRGLITVNNELMQQTLDEILSDPNDIRTDFRRIQDWVANSIEYKKEVKQEWQWPTETLKKRSGDCKDYSTLLCTLWRVYGVPAQDVYVAIGQSRTNERHAFLIEKYMTGEWQVVEPQIGGFVLAELTAIDISEKYAITFLFNDIEYINEAASIAGKIRGVVSVNVSHNNIKKDLPRINLFTCDHSTVAYGEAVQLTWSVEGATYVGIDQGVGTVSSVGTCLVIPTETLEYRLVAGNEAGSVMGNITVKVLHTAYSKPKLGSELGIDNSIETFVIGFDGWYSNNNKVENVNVGQLTSARINLKNGNSGQYIMRVWRDIGDGNDEILTQRSYMYDGESEDLEITFAPAYAIGEASTRGYWLDIVADSEQLWVMPNAYPPRLTAIPKPSSGQLSIGFIGWFTSVDAVTTSKVGIEVTTGITLAGGDEGEYTLYVKRDTIGLNDEAVAKISFHYYGNSALQEIKFIPEYVIQEDGTRGYYLELYHDNKYIWSLNGSYPPRLTVIH
ncbi:MAG: transglutaminase domain-containing protein [Dehalococcoidia bacterium]|nr:transglutaminase domain-containing protein [Dehalococcoidia bacterium]